MPYRPGHEGDARSSFFIRYAQYEHMPPVEYLVANYFSDYFKKFSNEHSYNTRHKIRLILTKVKHNFPPDWSKTLKMRLLLNLHHTERT